MHKFDSERNTECNAYKHTNNNIIVNVKCVRTPSYISYTRAQVPRLHAKIHSIAIYHNQGVKCKH